jgi:hypothetical protein
MSLASSGSGKYEEGAIYMIYGLELVGIKHAQSIDTIPQMARECIYRFVWIIPDNNILNLDRVL